MSGKQKGDMLGEACPYCGKKFKRLKTHLNHCKMAPAVTSSKSSDTIRRDALLKATVDKSKKKTTITSRDKLPAYSMDNTESDLKIKNNKKSARLAEQSVNKVTRHTTTPPLIPLQPTNPVAENLCEDTGQLKKKWQGRSNQENVKLSEALREKGRKSSTKATALGKITLAADVLKRTTSGHLEREVQPTSSQKTPKSKASLSLPGGEEAGLSASPLANTVSIQEPVQRAHPVDDQHFKPSHPKPKAQKHLQEMVKTSLQVPGKDLKSVQVMDRAVPHSYEVVKTSVWDHIRGGLLSRKYGGLMVSLPRTKPVVDNAVSLTSAFNVSLPQTYVNPQTAVALAGPCIKHADSSKPPPASPAQGLPASQSEALSSKPRSMEWMSTVTGGYHGMEVYKPPGRAALGPEHDWMKPSSAPPPPKPPPDTLVSEILDGSKRPHGPSSSNAEGQVHGPRLAPLAERRLADVTLKELPTWLADRIPQSPREGAALLNNGWQWYYRRYINVRKGGIGGIAMLLASYCVLSYVWSYPHLKLERWRKHH